MKLQTNNIKDYQRYFERGVDTPCLVTKFLVDEQCLECSNVILTQHSEEFYGKDEIFLLEFEGQLDKVYDIIELLHGRDVDVNVENIEAIAKFATTYKCKDLMDLAETWIRDEFSTITDCEMIVRLAKIVLNVSNMGYKKILSNRKIREIFSSNAGILLKDMQHSDVIENIFTLHLILPLDQIQVYQLPSLSNGIDTEYQYKTILNLINEYIEEDPYSINKIMKEIEPIFEKGINLVSNQELFKLHSKVEKRFEQLKRDVLSGAVQEIQTSEILESGVWKDYDDWKDVIRLKERPDVSEFQYFDIVHYMLANKAFDESTVDILLSSIDKGICFRISRTLDVYITDDKQKALVDGLYYYKFSTVRFEHYTLTKHNETETVFKKELPEGEGGEEQTIVVQIKNVNNKARISIYKPDHKNNLTILHLFAFIPETEGVGKIFTEFKSLVSSTYSDFVDHILKNIRAIKLCVIYTNTHLEPNSAAGGSNKKRRVDMQ